MKPILIVYATREGQTQRIAEHIGAALRSHHSEAELVDAAESDADLDIERYRAVILAASVHAGKHEHEMVSFVKAHRAQLEAVPTVFLSTSLSEAGAEDATHSPEQRARSRADAERMIDDFFTATGFRSTLHKPVAGALRYSQYNWFIRLIMKRIAKAEGGNTDISRDYEYTDWVDLDRFVADLIRSDFRPTATASAVTA